jgi:hypothetical protein
MSEDAPKGLMTVPQAARWLGMQGRAGAVRLRRYMLQREAAAGTTIMVRHGRGAAKRYLVTERILRKHAPELIPVRRRMPPAAKRAVDTLRAELTEAHDRIDDLEARIFAMAETMRKRWGNRQ